MCRRNRVDVAINTDNSQVPEKYFKHMEGTKGLFEIRVEVGNNIFRIFSFFDKGNLVVFREWLSKENTKDT